MMLITLDNLAHRYHCLPSEALSRANTFDLKVLDTGAKWSKYKHEKDNPGSAKAPKDHSVSELTAILNKTKEVK